jgi:hypothetical protein
MLLFSCHSERTEDCKGCTDARSSSWCVGDDDASIDVVGGHINKDRLLSIPIVFSCKR